MTLLIPTQKKTLNRVNGQMTFTALEFRSRFSTGRKEKFIITIENDGKSVEIEVTEESFDNIIEGLKKIA